MDQLIRFRHGADTVSQNEFESLMPAISNIIGKNVLVSLLYNHLHSKLNESEYNVKQKLEQINHEIAAICNQNNPLTQPKLDKISQPLINNISSYLDLKSYTNFERCNRTIFIAARSPVPFYHVDEEDIAQYLSYCNENNQIVDINRFCRVKSLELDITNIDLNEVIDSNLIFNDLRNLKICFDEEEELKKICESENIQLSKLNKLTLENFELSIDDWPWTNTILHKPSNLKFLDINYSHRPPIIYTKSQNIIRNLSGLSLQFDEDYDPSRDVSILISLENDILNSCCFSELTSFHTASELTSFHTASELALLNFNHTRFPNLTELCLENNYSPNAISVISKFQHLKRIRFNLSHDTDIKMELNTKFMNGLLSLKSLESINFGGVSLERIPTLFKLIQNGLMIHKKEKLKIYIHCKDIDKESVDGDIHIDLEVFVNALEFFISDFMLIFSARFIPQTNSENIVQWINGLNPQRFCCFYQDLSRYGYFIVANRGCKINTCQREWIMECTICCKKPECLATIT